MNFKELIKSLFTVNRELKEQSLNAVNISLTLRNWFFGFYIVEFEQSGKDRAEYGKSLLGSISNEMAAQHKPNSEERELRRFRQLLSNYCCRILPGL